MKETQKSGESAFIGESQANRKYLAWVKQADEEGHKGVAKLFRAIAGAETIHAHSDFNPLIGVKSTLENVEATWA